MKKYTSIFLPVMGGVFLIALGVILILGNLENPPFKMEMIIGPLIALSGLLFLAIFIFDKSKWWSLIPSLILIGIGGLIFVEQCKGAENQDLGPATFLFFTGLAFWLIYLFDRGKWWAIIPGGILWSLAGALLIGEENTFGGSVFLFGAALTFLMVYALPKPEGKLRWALIPAGIIAILGILFSLNADNWFKYIGPAALVIVGVIILIRSLKKRE